MFEHGTIHCAQNRQLFKRKTAKKPSNIQSSNFYCFSTSAYKSHKTKVPSWKKRKWRKTVISGRLFFSFLIKSTFCQFLKLSFDHFIFTENLNLKTYIFQKENPKQSILEIAQLQCCRNFSYRDFVLSLPSLI